MSFSRPTLSTLIDRARVDLETRMPGADARLRHSVLDALARTHAGALSGLYGYADWVSRQIHPDTADSEILARHAARVGILRKAASFATGPVTATGTNGVLIPAGSVLARVDGAQYATTADTTIAAGTAALTLEAAVSGPGFAMAAGQTLTFVELIAGVGATVTVGVGGIADGAAEEDDASLLRRLLLRIQTPPQGGSAADYQAWALAQAGVTRAWVKPAWLGLGTVGLTFTMDDRVNIIPTAPDLAAVQGALDILRPVTAQLTVFAPVAVAVPVTLTLSPNSVAVQAAVQAELADLFMRDAEPGGTIRKSRVSEAISIAAGETYHALTAPAADFVAPTAASLPVLGTVTFS